MRCRNHRLGGDSVTSQTSDCGAEAHFANGSKKNITRSSYLEAFLEHLRRSVPVPV
jgi:hypothetical protein